VNAAVWLSGLCSEPQGNNGTLRKRAAEISRPTGTRRGRIMIQTSQQLVAGLSID
jgi:hypothetical protein